MVVSVRGLGASAAGDGREGAAVHVRAGGGGWVRLRRLRRAWGGGVRGARLLGKRRVPIRAFLMCFVGLEVLG